MTSIPTFIQARDRKTAKQEKFALDLARELWKVLNRAGQWNETVSQWAKYTIDDLQEMIALARKGKAFNVAFPNRTEKTLFAPAAPAAPVVVEEVMVAPVVVETPAAQPVEVEVAPTTQTLGEFVDAVIHQYDLDIEPAGAAFVAAFEAATWNELDAMPVTPEAAARADALGRELRADDDAALAAQQAADAAWRASAHFAAIQTAVATMRADLNLPAKGAPSEDEYCDYDELADEANRLHRFTDGGTLGALLRQGAGITKEAAYARLNEIEARLRQRANPDALRFAKRVSAYRRLDAAIGVIERAARRLYEAGEAADCWETSAERGVFVWVRPDVSLDERDVAEAREWEAALRALRVARRAGMTTALPMRRDKVWYASTLHTPILMDLVDTPRRAGHCAISMFHGYYEFRTLRPVLDFMGDGCAVVFVDKRESKFIRADGKMLVVCQSWEGQTEEVLDLA